MVELLVRNVCEALPLGLEYLLESGKYEDSRAGRVLVAPCPVITITERPQERVLFSVVRDANPFFHLFEALWMLAGRDDAAFLDQFVHDFSSRFAEPDGRIHGAYGHRWRHHFDVDQIGVVINKLRNDHTDRQCVIAMWSPAWEPRGGNDLQGIWRDRPCNTHIYLRVRRGDVDHTGDHTEDVLDMSVCCRSNDAIWGAHGANAVHFSILQEYIAAHVGIGVGTLVQFSHNYHIYETMLNELDARDSARSFLEDDRYSSNNPPHIIPLIENVGTFDREIEFILDHPHSSNLILNPFCRMASTMRIAHSLYKTGYPKDALLVLRAAPQCDWTLAGAEWIARRLANAELKRAAR